MSKIMIPVSILKPVALRADRSVVVINHTVKPVLRTLMLVLAVICTTTGLEAQTADEWFEKGLDSFQWQKNDEASVYFRKATEADPGRDTFFLYLGITYHEGDKLQNAEEAYTRGLTLNGGDRDRLLLNRGNLRTARSDYDGASSDYTQLVDAGVPLSSSALLNRANLELNRSSFGSAVDDYSRYLIMEPDSPQRETIERLIGLLGARLSSDAELAALAADQARLEEERRLAEEAIRAEEEARRAALMAEVLQSLSDSGEDTTSISAGSEDIREDFEDSALED
jgi:tetratricopeptide (TPR) repeat protein